MTRVASAAMAIAQETVEHFGLGYSDRSGRALVRLFEQRGFPVAQMEESGLVGKRQDGSLYDRFRNRLPTGHQTTVWLYWPHFAASCVYRSPIAVSSCLLNTSAYFAYAASIC